MVPFMLLPPCLPSRATQYCYFIYFFYHIFILFFILFLFYHIISFNFFIYFYFLSSHFCYCLPAFLPDLPSLVIFGLVRLQKSFWCKINLPFYFFSPEKCNKLAKEHNHSHSPKKWFADLGDMPTWAYSLNPPPSKGLNQHVNFWTHPSSTPFFLGFLAVNFE